MTIIADENSVSVLCSRCNRRETIEEIPKTAPTERIDYALIKVQGMGWTHDGSNIFCKSCTEEMREAKKLMVTDEGLWLKIDVPEDELAEKLIQRWERKTFDTKVTR